MRWLRLTGLDWTGPDLIGLGMIGLGLKFWLAEAVPSGDGVSPERERDGGSRRETGAMSTANEGEEASPARVDSSEEAAWRVLVSVRLALVVALVGAHGNRGTNWPRWTRCGSGPLRRKRVESSRVKSSRVELTRVELS